MLHFLTTIYQNLSHFPVLSRQRPTHPCGEGQHDEAEGSWRPHEGLGNTTVTLTIKLALVFVYRLCVSLSHSFIGKRLLHAEAALTNCMRLAYVASARHTEAGAEELPLVWVCKNFSNKTLLVD